MSKWVDQCESVLQSIQAATEIPFAFERYTLTSEADKLPDTFIVYFLVDDPGTTYADGKETSHETRIQVSLFYQDTAQFKTIPDQITAAFIAAGFTRGSAGTIPYQAETKHYGWRQDFYYYERRTLC